MSLKQPVWVPTLAAEVVSLALRLWSLNSAAAKPKLSSLFLKSAGITDDFSRLPEGFSILGLLDLVKEKHLSFHLVLVLSTYMVLKHGYWASNEAVLAMSSSLPCYS